MKVFTGVALAALSLGALVGSVGSGVAGQAGTNPKAGATPAGWLQVAQAAPTQAALVAEGGPLFARNCAVCHGNAGQGDIGPKLAGDPFVNSAGAVIAQILHGAEEHGMPPFQEALNDRQIAAIATYVRNSWGNTAGPVLPEEVARTR